MKLPHCDDLFLKYFDPWLDAGLRKRRILKATRPDMETTPQWKGLSASELARLPADSENEVRKQIQTMVDAATEDWPGFLLISPPVTLDWIDAFDKYYTRREIVKVINKSDPSDYSNDYVVLCCEFGAVLGQSLIGLNPRLFWLPEYPYWETPIFDPRSGSVINVFSWAVKKMSEYGVDDRFKAKVLKCLELIDES
jgi:hypothetical protein